MIKTINMQEMRYLNLFEKITRIDTRFFFNYNETLMFCVPKFKLSQALGRNTENLKKLSDILKKRIRVLANPRGIEDIESFIKAIVAPVEFKELNIRGDEVILTTGSQSKASLLGRNKRRLMEMKEIVRDFFGKEFKII
jgi:hypothetical protein